MKLLTNGSKDEIQKIIVEDDWNDIKLLQMVRELTELLDNERRNLRELGGKYQQLQGWYNKIADQWNAFQAVHRPTNRNVQRAEAVGEFARRQVEALMKMGDEEQKQMLIRLLISTAYPANEFTLERQ